jgi:hypothetical protein
MWAEEFSFGTSTEPEHFIMPGTTKTPARLMKMTDILRALLILFESFMAVILL